MADGSTGDRVEGRWQAFVAAVAEVHARGTADVQYAVDGSGGVLLTAKEDGYDEEKNGGGEEEEGVRGGWLSELRQPKRATLHDAWRQTLLGRWLLHQGIVKGESTGVVRKTRR